MDMTGYDPVRIETYARTGRSHPSYDELSLTNKHTQGLLL